jgi:hypothetical protein
MKIKKQNSIFIDKERKRTFEENHKLLRSNNFVNNQNYVLSNRIKYFYYENYIKNSHFIINIVFIITLVLSLIKLPLLFLIIFIMFIIYNIIYFIYKKIRDNIDNNLRLFLV